MVEVRTGKRFPLQLPITIRDQQTARKQTSTTWDVSAAGVYVRADKPLKVGSRITFEILLPAQVVGTEHPVKIHCTGRVVRAEPVRRTPRSKQTAEGRRGMACVIDQYRFIRK